MMRRSVLLAALAVLSTGCYHATVTTGRPLGTTVINQPWAMGFIYGLVPPKTVEAAKQCPGGVAQVETQHSFLNSLVGGLTFGIVTPMTIKVTCASGGGASVPSIRGQGDAAQSVSDAADLAKTLGTPVLIRF
jgi:Bor protein